MGSNHTSSRRFGRDFLLLRSDNRAEKVAAPCLACVLRVRTVGPGVLNKVLHGGWSLRGVLMVGSCSEILRGFQRTESEEKSINQTRHKVCANWR